MSSQFNQPDLASGQAPALVDMLHEYFVLSHWNTKRLGENEILLEVPNSLNCSYSAYINWSETRRCMHYTLMLDLHVEKNRRAPVDALISLINPRLWLGHFEIEPRYETVMLRDSQFISVGDKSAIAVIENVIDMSLNDCDTYFGAFLRVMRDHCTPLEALKGVDHHA